MKVKTKIAEIKHCVVISDLHFGCSLALCPPQGVKLDNGSEYKPSDLQKKLWRIWSEFWNKWIPSQIHDEPFCLVINGDLLEGIHHNVVTQISQNLDDQTHIAKLVLNPIIKRSSKLFVVRGTEAHSGRSCQEEERLATELGAIPITPYSTTNYELWLSFNGKLIHFCHHLGFSSSISSEFSSLSKEVHNTLSEAARWGFRYPDVIVRSHRHTHVELTVPCDNKNIIAFSTPSWQLKTPFSFKLASAKIALPQIGGSLISIHEGSIITKHFVKHIKQNQQIVYV